MNITDKSIDCVVLNMSRFSEWNRGIVNRNYFIVEQLKKRPEIRTLVMVDVLPHTLRRAVHLWLEMRRQSKEKTVAKYGLTYTLREVEANRLYYVSTFDTLFSEDLFIRHLCATIKQLRLNNIMVWSYLPTFVRIFYQDVFNWKIFDAVDDWSVHSQYKQISHRIQNNYKQIDQSADAVFTVSKTLLQQFPKNSNAHWVPNGVDVHFYDQALQKKRDSKQKNPTLVYVGVIQDRVDIDLLAFIAKRRPLYSIVLVGPVWKGVSIEKLRNFQNIHLLGFRPHNEVPMILANADVGIVPHNNSALVQTMNPMKIYEYLAAGIPVVTTDGTGFEAFADGVFVAKNPEEFLSTVDTALNKNFNPDMLRNMIQPYQWSDRFTVMWNTISPMIQNTLRPRETIERIKHG